MPITDPRTVLLLGAGVSEPFGMPLGGPLINMLAQEIEREKGEATVDSPYGGKTVATERLLNWAHDLAYWHSRPIFGTFIRARVDNDFRLSKEKAEEAYNELDKLERLLRNQTAETIDAFIAENPGVATSAKVAVAALMLRHSYRTPNERRELLLRPFAERETEPQRDREPPSERNWIHLLINIVRHGIDNGRVDRDNKIQIVTFNYDTILEHVLARQFSNREIPQGRYEDFIEIVHVHGEFETLEPRCLDPGQTALKWAPRIDVVNERSPCDHVAQARQRAREMIAAANRIYSIGFSFAGPNCRLLELEKRTKGVRRHLVYGNFDGNIGVKESAERYVAASSAIERAGTWNRKLGVADFIKAGFLGEPPG